MTETKKSKKLTHDQLQAILNNDHIRQHLIQHGLISYRGDVVPQDEHRRRSRRRHTSKKKFEKYPTYTRRPLITVSPKRHTTNPKRQDRSRSFDGHLNDRRIKSATTSQSKQTNKTQSSTRFSSSNQSTSAQNVLLRRAVSPKIIPAGNRCRITMVYSGSETVIEYDRDLFDPEGDEIIVMQQHCGGENLLVYKGSLKPDDTFLFESRRHSDYPFALAFYVNGLIDNRLSICCESRCNNFMRIGGKRGTFAIVNVENARPCRRCRFEQRMKKLTESEPKSAKTVDHQEPKSSPTTNVTKKSEPTKSRTPIPQSNGAPTKNSKTSVAGASSSESTVPRSKSPETPVARNSNPEPTGTRTLSPASSISDMSSPKPSATRSMSSEERPESPPALRNRPTTTSNHRSKGTSSPDEYIPDFEESEERIHSSSSTPRQNDQIDVPETIPNNQRRVSTISTEESNEVEIRTISDESDADFEEARGRANRRRNSDDS